MQKVNFIPVTSNSSHYEYAPAIIEKMIINRVISKYDYKICSHSGVILKLLMTGA